MATPDPCAALFGSVKTACENAKTSLSGSSSGGGVIQGLLGLNGSFDWRHFMVRVAEFGVGLALVVIAINAGLKQAVTGSPVVKSAKGIAKKVSK